jgi:hypothetical protein
METEKTKLLESEEVENSRLVISYGFIMNNWAWGGKCVHYWIEGTRGNYASVFYNDVNILGDSKWLRISMATMYENVCGNCVDRIELAFLHISTK